MMSQTQGSPALQLWPYEGIFVAKLKFISAIYER